MRLFWQRRPVQDAWADLSQGCYLLRTNLDSGQTPEQLWQTYILLTEVEAAFRATKSELGLRPIGHQTTQRVKAHIFICFLGLVVWKSLEQSLALHGLARSARKLIEEFAGWKSMDIILPTNTGHELRLGVISEPDLPLAILLQHMGLKVPKRLRQIPKAPAQIPNVVETLAEKMS